MSRLLALGSLVGIAGGAALWVSGHAAAGSLVWAATTAVVLVPLTVAVGRDLLRGRLGVDLIALLSMGGALTLGENLAGAVIALMLSGGQALEVLAQSRAQRDLSALLERAPRLVHRFENGEWATPPLAEVRAGDRLLVKPGESVPVDGLVVGAAAILDESALTGESRPVERSPGDAIQSGAVNAGAAFELRAVASAAESTYAGIVRLVEEAQRSKAPFVRLADRVAIVFLPVTLLLAGAAWLATGDPVRALAVLVVATPCPLILAAPVALVAGLSRCARRGVLVKGGGALEGLARSRILLLDKTGTITTGVPEVAEVLPLAGVEADEVLRLAASLDQVSPHPFAPALVRAARRRGLALAAPTGVGEQPGAGIAGIVEGHRIAIGRLSWVVPGERHWPRDVRQARRRAALEGASSVFVAVDGQLAAAIILHDPIRADSPAALRALRRGGIRRVVLVTGDHPEVADVVGAGIGADAVLAERSPEDKLEAVRAERTGGYTMMVGDGINDAPALAAADVGVAMGARGAAVSSQAADVVVLVDRLDRLAEALAVARRTMVVAWQSVAGGMALSGIGMLVAAAGYLPPVAGALTQEAIDVLVILNALRALTERRGRPAADTYELTAETRAEHRELLPEVERLRAVADRLTELAPDELRRELGTLREFLETKLLPHDAEEDRALYPMVARVMGGEDPTGAMTRTHLEIAHQVRLLGRLTDELAESEPEPDDLRDVRRVLYGLYAILRLHFAQEEQHVLPLLEGDGRRATASALRPAARAGRRS